MLVVSYNPGYQSVLKDLKESTRQRMVAIELDFPGAEVEHAVLISEGGATPELADALVRLAGAIRGLTGTGLKRSEEHTSELQSLMRISYAVFCLKKKQQRQ